MQELKRFPTLQSDIAAAANESLERFRDESRKTVLRLVEMESSYLTVDFFRKLNTEPEKNNNSSGPNAQNAERYTDNHLRRIGISSIVEHFLKYSQLTPTRYHVTMNFCLFILSP